MQIRPPIIEECLTSPEGTKKYLIKLDSGSMIEMVKIPEKEKTDFMCLFSKQDVLSQCTDATGDQVLKEKNLSNAEIIGQLGLPIFMRSLVNQFQMLFLWGWANPFLILSLF